LSELLTVLLPHLNEQQVGFTGKELTEDEFIFDTSVNKTVQNRKTQRALMIGAEFSIEDQRLMFCQFFSTSFPFFFLTVEKFNQIMPQFGWPTESLENLFRSFKTKGDKALNKYLSYPEFISGLAATEQLTPHGDVCGEARCRYIFRFYDKNSDGRLDFEEFCDMVKDIRLLRGDGINPDDIRAEAESSAK
jgi:hypothetical protein